MKHALWRTIIILILLATSTALAGSIYKWVDKEGGVHYSDRAPEENQVEGDVEIYTTSWCRYCRDAKRYFRSRGVAFKEYDVEKDPKAAPTSQAL